MDPVERLPFNGSLSDSLGSILKLKDSPFTYGDEQKFAELKQNAILDISKMLLEMRNDVSISEKNDADNFNKVLTKVGELRRSIAFAMGTPEAESFGVVRHSGDYMSTFLSNERYAETNKKIKELILNSLPHIKDKEKSIRITLKNSRYTFKLMTESKLLFQNPFVLYHKTINGEHNFADEQMFGMNHLIDHKQKILPLLCKLQGKKFIQSEVFLDPNMYVFCGRIELKTMDSWRTLTRHFTVLKRNDQREIDVDDFKLHGITALLHTSYREFKFHDEIMAKLFNQILKNETSHDILNQDMREFEYRLHHLCYFIRGSATINEIIMEALKLTVNPQYDLIGNLEALANPYL